MVRWYYEQPERLREFEALALEDNVVDWVLQRAQVETADQLRDIDGADRDAERVMRTDTFMRWHAQHPMYGAQSSA